MGKSQRDKGARGEREVATILRDRGFDAGRVPNSGGLVEKGDIKSKDLKRLHLEVKFQETAQIWKWLQQASDEAESNQEPVLIFRKSRQPWRVIVTLDHYLNLIEDSEYETREVSGRTRKRGIA